MNPREVLYVAMSRARDNLVVVGDPAFDQAYVIRGYDPSTVRALLVPAARAPLLTLAALGATQLTDRGLDVDGLSPDPDRVERAIRAAIEAAEALGW